MRLVDILNVPMKLQTRTDSFCKSCNFDFTLNKFQNTAKQKSKRDNDKDFFTQNRHSIFQKDIT